jgi:hypothetical protein
MGEHEPFPSSSIVTTGHGRSQNGVVSLAYAGGPRWLVGSMDCRIKSGNDDLLSSACETI